MGNIAMSSFITLLVISEALTSLFKSFIQASTKYRNPSKRTLLRGPGYCCFNPSVLEEDTKRAFCVLSEEFTGDLGIRSFVKCIQVKYASQE